MRLGVGQKAKDEIEKLARSTRRHGRVNVYHEHALCELRMAMNRAADARDAEARRDDDAVHEAVHEGGHALRLAELFDAMGELHVKAHRLRNGLPELTEFNDECMQCSAAFKDNTISEVIAESQLYRNLCELEAMQPALDRLSATQQELQSICEQQVAQQAAQQAAQQVETSVGFVPSPPAPLVASASPSVVFPTKSQFSKQRGLVMKVSTI